MHSRFKNLRKTPDRLEQWIEKVDYPFQELTDSFFDGLKLGQEVLKKKVWHFQNPFQRLNWLRSTHFNKKNLLL